MKIQPASYEKCQHCRRDIRDCSPTLGGPTARPCPGRDDGAQRARAAFARARDVQAAYFAGGAR